MTLIKQKKILEISPDIVINATAYTFVDKAEEEKNIADLINHEAVKNIAHICSSIGCWLIHISTDYVFDGYSKVPYKELDKTSPTGAYGKTKLDGELAIQSSNCKYIIIRTSWLFSEYGNNFLKTMLRIGKNSNDLSIVDDQIGCPTYAQDLASTISNIVTSLDSKKISGIYHYSGYKSCSWYDFALAIFDQAKAYDLIIPDTINPVSTSSYQTKAHRPGFSVLDCAKIKTDFNVALSNWDKGIIRAINKLNKLT